MSWTPHFWTDIPIKSQLYYLSSHFITDIIVFFWLNYYLNKFILKLICWYLKTQIFQRNFFLSPRTTQKTSHDWSNLKLEKEISEQNRFICFVKFIFDINSWIYIIFYRNTKDRVLQFIQIIKSWTTLLIQIIKATLNKINKLANAFEWL